jgi:acetyl esterase/lipase
LVARIISLLTTLLTCLIVFQPKGGVIQVMLWGPKLYASALSPQLGLLSGLFAILGFKRRDWLLALVSFVGTAVAAKHVIEVTTPREANFVEVFGQDWQQRIPAGLWHRLRRRSWYPYYRRRPQGPRHLDVIYGTGSDSGQPLHADILRPPPGVAHTGVAMIFAHGGGWLFGTKNIEKFPYFQRLVSQGHVVMDINYSLAPHSSIPGMVRDLKQAILWLKQEAAAFGVNSERVVLTGQSAGAHLSLLAAYTPNQPYFQPNGPGGDTSVSGVVSYHGPADMVALYHDIQTRFVQRVPDRLVSVLDRALKPFSGHGGSLTSGLAGIIGGRPDEIPDLYRLISPVTYVSVTCPPTLLIQGTHDALVDHQEVERLYRLLKDAGAPVLYVPLANCGHAFECILPRFSPPAQTAAYYMERFLALMSVN